VDEQVRLSALDWDGATLAPPERDLAVLLLGEQPVGGNTLNRVLAVYPEVPLKLDLFAFFRARSSGGHARVGLRPLGAA
jgi:aminoglycoside phosphotransferase (APT) family kinase protein